LHPGPARDTRPACAGAGHAGHAGPDEVGEIGFAADPVPDEAQPGQGSLDQPAPGHGPARHHAVVRRQVVAHQRGVAHGAPPRRLGAPRERPAPVPYTAPGKPFCRLAHRRDGPLERARPGRRIAHMIAVPFDPAGNRAEPGVLAARHEPGATLLTNPLLSHCPMLRREYGGAERCPTRAAARCRPPGPAPDPAAPSLGPPRGPGSRGSGPPWPRPPASATMPQMPFGWRRPMLEPSPLSHTRSLAGVMPAISRSPSTSARSPEASTAWTVADSGSRNAIRSAMVSRRLLLLRPGPTTQGRRT